MEPLLIELNYGSTLRAEIKWRTPDDQPITQPGFSASPFQETGALNGKLRLSQLDTQTGTMALFMSAEDSALLSPGGRYGFRVRYVQPNGDIETTDVIYLGVK